MYRSALLASAALLLGACAPRAAAPAPIVTASTAVSGVSYYPQQTGLSWSYVPEGEEIRNPYVLRATGPTLLGSTPVQGFRLTGRGVDRTWYRSVSDAGVLLHGFTLPGATVTITPPWREYPTAGTFAPGLTWSGRSTLNILDSAGKLRQSVEVEYRYTVLEQRTVQVAGKTYRVWVINRQISGSSPELFAPSQNLWFSPYLGEVRTPEALLLIGTNFQSGNRP